VRMTPQMIAETLGQTGLCICPDFLSKQSVDATRADFEQIQKDGGLYRAGTGQGENRQVQDLIRRDEIYWLDRSVRTRVQSTLWKRLDALKLAFNQILYLGLGDMEGHYAAYPEGGFYKRHLDCFQNNNSRIVSIIVYLNPTWNASDGGQLRLYEKDNSHTDVIPLGGTMVCFLSRESEHEVLTSSRRRVSFAGWYRSF
jgi:SM-20-related protein